MQKFDVLIVGAGMVGLTLALAIRNSTQLSVALVDDTPVSKPNEVIGTKVSAINVASKNIFVNLGVWPSIEKNRSQAYQHMHVWDKSGLGKLDFCAQDSQAFPPEEQLGWIVENTVIRYALWQKAQQDEGIHFFTDNKLASISHGDNEVFATFVSDNTQAAVPPILAKLVVGADGANSWLRTQMNMAMIFKDYDHHAIVATVHCTQGHQNTAWQVFLPTGPLAFLPIQSANDDETNALCSIVFSTSPEEAARLSRVDTATFSKVLTAASDGKLGNITLKSDRITFPLSMRLAQDFVKERMVLIGDAAHTIHPLAGQGVNLGLLDAAALAQTLTANINDQNEPFDHWFSPSQLKAFARWRKAEATEMISAMAAIKKTFEPQQSPLKLLRGVGMNLLNNFRPAKNQLIGQALGIKPNLPSLAYQKDLR
jgi:2-octaprenylphenol hydroxylase